ncbi:hypothetical protein EV182_003832 [Spiromyces aspiralis]|uniref:Uncharacterized protein n=1 Tax=Spiromyces aspiralis TaxID=68401 RepID=A0ACC1HXD4_9FUNG|nr:hypothetical protein EV182_003832 [Spiromyces aspiralis]
MSEYSMVKSSKLKFKGWVEVESLEDLEGPIAFYFRDDPLRVLSLPPNLGDAATRADIEALSSLGSSSVRQSLLAVPISGTVDTAVPTSVDHVFIGQRSISSTADPNAPPPTTFTFKTSRGQYLSCDRLGFVYSDAPAVGPLETWTPIIRKTGDEAKGVASLMTEVSGKEQFLRVELPSSSVWKGEDNLGGSSAKDRDKPLQLRADADSIGFCETFIIKCQAANRRKNQTKEAASNAFSELAMADLSEDEQEKLKKFQSYKQTQGVTHSSLEPAGRHKLSKEERKQLKRARAEGRYNEALLERRTKMKSDKYC